MGKRNKIDGAFAWRKIEMLEAPAFRVLSLSGHRVLARIEIELSAHGGKDNGKLPVTFTDFEAYGIERHAIGPAIRECEALGFLEISERGFAGVGEFKRPSTYRLTYRHLDRAEPTDEWRRIKTMEEATAAARLARKSPVGKTPTGKKQKTSAEKPTVPVRETPTENGGAPVRETPTTDQCGKPPLLSISPGTTRSAASPKSKGRRKSEKSETNGAGRHSREGVTDAGRE